MILSLDLQPYRWITVWDYGFLRLNLTQIIMTRWDSISYKCLWQKLASLCLGYRCNRCVDLVSLRKTESDPSGSITEEQFLIFQRKGEEHKRQASQSQCLFVILRSLKHLDAVRYTSANISLLILSGLYVANVNAITFVYMQIKAKSIRLSQKHIFFMITKQVANHFECIMFSKYCVLCKLKISVIPSYAQVG